MRTALCAILLCVGAAGLAFLSCAGPNTATEVSRLVRAEGRRRGPRDPDFKPGTKPGTSAISSIPAFSEAA